MALNKGSRLGDNSRRDNKYAKSINLHRFDCQWRRNLLTKKIETSKQRIPFTKNRLTFILIPSTNSRHVEWQSSKAKVDSIISSCNFVLYPCTRSPEFQKQRFGHQARHWLALLRRSVSEAGTRRKQIKFLLIAGTIYLKLFKRTKLCYRYFCTEAT